MLIFPAHGDAGETPFQQTTTGVLPDAEDEVRDASRQVGTPDAGRIGDAHLFPANPVSPVRQAPETSASSGLISPVTKTKLFVAEPETMTSAQGQLERFSRLPSQQAITSTKGFQKQAEPAQTYSFTQNELAQIDRTPPQEQTPASAEIDPELGILRLQEQPLSLELGTDPELGILRLDEQPPPQIPPRPSPVAVYLVGNLDYFNSNNIISAVDPVGDQLFRPAIALVGSARLGERTTAYASAEGALIRYVDLSELDYNELKFDASLTQRLTPRVYGTIGWTNQQLFLDEGGDRFLNDHSLRLALGRRDLLSPRLGLDTYYQFRASFAEPSDRSRIRNTVGASLLYALQPNLQAGLNSQMTWASFTEQDRDDFYGQVFTQLSYQMSRNSNLSLFAGFSFGDSSNPFIDFNDFIFGANVSVGLRLF